MPPKKGKGGGAAKPDKNAAKGAKGSTRQCLHS